jgi:hypothetical protein
MMPNARGLLLILGRKLGAQLKELISIAFTLRP